MSLEVIAPHDLKKVGQTGQNLKMADRPRYKRKR